jgi:hypothetical protein
MAKPVPWKRILAEFFAIAAGVSLGLMGDDIRDRRNELRSESEYLQLLDRDLGLDADALRYTLELSGQETAAHLLRRFRRASEIPTDSVELSIAALFVSYSYEQPRPTFLSLRESGQLSIIQDAALRADLTDYYDLYQVRLQVFVEEYRFWQRRLRLELSPYVRAYPPDGRNKFDVFPLPDDFVDLRAPWSEVSEDRELWNDIAEVGVRVAEIRNMIEEHLERNETLRQRIQQHNQ